MLAQSYSGILPRRARAKIALLLFAGVVLAGAAGSTNATAQSYEQLEVPDTPLVLDATGSIYVGGRTVSETDVQIGLYGGGEVAVDQMYVQYMIPRNHAGLAVVLVHGGTLTGKTFETTPDGRMGWYEYFARKGYRSYLVDQVRRGRSGFDAAAYNDVRAGIAEPKTQPKVRRLAREVAWALFRIGTEDGKKFPDTQFPVDAAGEFAKQAVPDLTEGLPADNPNFRALSQLAGKLNNAVLIGHSQSGLFPFEAVLLDAEGIRGAVAIEPGGCKSGTYSDEQMTRLSKIPILVLFGDHIDAQVRLDHLSNDEIALADRTQRTGTRWRDLFRDCQKFVDRINSLNGNATMMHTPALGIKGNSHMMMQDKNNLEIANLIMKWIDDNVAGNRRRTASFVNN